MSTTGTIFDPALVTVCAQEKAVPEAEWTPLQRIMIVFLSLPVLPLLAAAVLIWAMPCPSTMRLINSCASGQMPGALMLIVIVAGYGAPAVLAMLLSAEEENPIRFAPLLIATAGLFLAGGVWSWLLGIARDDPFLQPTALSTLREHGQADLVFGVHSIEPIRANDGVTGFHVTLAVTSTLGGTVTVHVPESSSASLPPLVAFDPTNDQVPEPRPLRLEAGRVATAEFWLRPTLAYRPLTDSVCTWALIWDVDRIPAYPLYLFGLGSVARVGPLETPGTTHVVSDMRTTPLPCPDLRITAAAH